MKYKISIKSFIMGLLLSLVLSFLLCYLILFLIGKLVNVNNIFVFFILIIISSIILYYNLSEFLTRKYTNTYILISRNLRRYKKEEKYKESTNEQVNLELPKQHTTFVILPISFICFSIPCFIIYFFILLFPLRQSMQIAVFLLSTGISIIYFMANKDKFPSLPDKVTFFSGVCVGPIAIVDILL